MPTESRRARAARLAARPYARMLIPDPETPGMYIARVLEFPSIAMEGETANEAIDAVDDALASVIEVMLEDGEDVPPPLYAREYSGRLQVRLPPSLHARAVTLAQADGVSLNRWLSDAVARAAGACERKD